MSALAIVIILMVLGAVLLTLVVLPLLSGGDVAASRRSNMRNMVSSQRVSSKAAKDDKSKVVFETGDLGARRISSSRPTLVKKLRWAQFKIPPAAFVALEFGISLETERRGRCSFANIDGSSG